VGLDHELPLDQNGIWARKDHAGAANALADEFWTTEPAWHTWRVNQMNSGDLIFAIDLAGIALSLLSLCWQYTDRRNLNAADRRRHIKIASLCADEADE